MDAPANENVNNSSSSSTARIPSSSSYSRASDYANRNSYPPNASTRSSLAPTKSHPNTRVPSPARPRQYERERERDRDRDVIAPSARYATYPETTGLNGTPNPVRPPSRPPSAYQRPPSRAHGGRTSVPVEAGTRYSSASAAAAAHTAQMAARSQTLPGASGRRHTTAAMVGPEVPQAQGMQRSKTLPGEMLAATSRRDRATAAPEPPRRSSDRYEYRRPVDDYEESEESEEEDEREDPVRSGWTHVTVDEAMEEKRVKETKTIDRVRAWADNVKNVVTRHDRDGEREREQREERVREPDRTRSRSYHYVAPGDGEHDGYDEDQYDAQTGSAAIYARERERERERGRLTRHATAPEVSYAPVSKASQNVSANYVGGPGESRITDEPEDMHGYSRSPQQPLSRSGSHRSPMQYPQTRQSPYKGREREREYREERYRSGSSTGSESDGESEDEYDPKALGRSSTRERERNVGGTPHPAAVRRLTERSDTLRVDDGIDMITANFGKAHLPSPRSLRQSSRTPSSRPSFEQVQAERERGREREYERAKTANGHLAAGTSSASGAAAAAGGFAYGTPPITPTRQDHTRNSDATRSPYASQPISSASAAAMAATEPAPAFQTPARLAYLYRGTSSTPSPASHRSGSTQPQLQPYSSTQAYSQPHPQSQTYPQAPTVQYGQSTYPTVVDPKPRKRSPRASRSPSPLPPGQGTSSSSAYYAALGRERAPSRAQGHSHPHDHSHSHGNSLSHGHSSGHSHAHGHPHGHGHSHAHHSRTHGHTSSQVAAVPPVTSHDSHRRSGSRTAALAGSGYSSASGAAAVVSSASASAAAQAAVSNARHVRAGFWNKRGDHLTDTGYVVYCPPGRCYPRELADYPDSAFKDHLGNVVHETPDMLRELPESVPKSAGRVPEKGYDTVRCHVDSCFHHPY